MINQPGKQHAMTLSSLAIKVASVVQVCETQYAEVD
jgi:hypothetical protein